MSKKPDEIKLAHGGGGTLMQELIRREIVPILGGAATDIMTDSVLLELPGPRAAFTTDSFVVQPLFFPGGDIGRLAVCGTVNDLATRGARPLALSLGLILEEGFSMDALRRIMTSIARAAEEAGVQVATGDTKVVERGGCDGLLINTSGVGSMPGDLDFGPDRIEPGDVLIVNGPIGDHGIAVMSARQDLGFTSPVLSDVAPLNGLVEQVLQACGPALKCLKDPTRGGLSANLNEMALKVGFILEEEAIPVRPEVRGACDLLGLEVLTVANEGKMLMAVAPDAADTALAALHAHPLGKDAVVIGRADARSSLVRMKTTIGGERIIDTPYGEELPRIC